MYTEKSEKQKGRGRTMGRRATCVNLLGQQETGTLGQVPSLGCCPSGFRMHF